MTKRMIDADALLEWIYSNGCDDGQIFADNLADKIVNDPDDLLATIDTQSTVDPEEWKVGDRVCADYDIVNIPHNEELKRYLQIISNNLAKGFNIDATLRAKDKEIAELKSQITNKGN